MVSATTSKGAKCVIGFKEQVGGAEYWYRYVAKGLNEGKTIQQALHYADIHCGYNPDVLSSPNNTETNRLVSGITNKKIS